MKRICILLFVIVSIVIGGYIFTSNLSQKYVNMLIAIKGIDNVSWQDFERYSHQDIGSGNYVYQYELSNGSYLYLSGPDLASPPIYIYIVNKDGTRVDLKN